MSKDIKSERTICFPIKNNEILLGMKLRGFGSGKYNGFGGKLQTGETPEDAAIRELEEESGLKVLVSDLQHTALIDFEFPFKPEFNQRVYIFIISNFDDTHVPTQEMDPFWFDISDVPYGKMWDSDKLWLPSLIDGKKFYAKFIWKEDNETVEEYYMKFMDVLKY
jgi:8-oxo-dGTP diphosphatase